ncbi:MAG: ribosome-associated translation inhibitor RaiA [Treponemataceae bacterium]
MNIDVKAVHFTLREGTREFLDKKIARIPNAENMIIDLLFKFTKEKEFKAECTVNFRWGVSVHVSDSDFELNPAIDKLIDKLEAKVIKEKEKVKDKHER